ncbi:MAG: response regulator, partial [Bacteroidota bacterium]
VRQNSYDLLLMDMQMPVMDGLEATQIIRTQLQCVVPIIALTANASNEHRERCLRVGMNDYIVKPFASEALLSKIHDLLHIRHTPSDESNTKSFSTPSIQEVYDLSSLERETQDSKKMLYRRLATFSMGTSFLLKEIESALKRSDEAKTKELIHKLKNALKMLGAMPLYEIAEQLEKETDPNVQEKTFLTLKNRMLALSAYLQTLY